MLPKGIIFDLDDTIIQFDAVAEPTWRSVCEYFTDGEKIFCRKRRKDIFFP